MVGVAEVFDPGYGGARREHAGALEVQHTGQGDAIAGPAAAVGEEVLRLCGTGAGVQVCKVIATTDETGVCGAGVVAAEGRVDVGQSLSRLSDA
jgi:hypothetical protein